MVVKGRKIHMKIKAILVMQDKEVQTIKIPRNTKFIKALIGNDLLKVRLDKDIMLIVNRNANVTEFNRIVGGNIVCGTFIVVAIKNNRRVSMNKRQIRKYTNMFKLRKHKRKIDIYKDEYLEEYYSTKRKMKQKNAEQNKEEIFNIAA